ncbi:hypothetical protein [Streptomyces sp. NPDC051014]|uniref:hypothetical protein n=1 Tax=Streptomyces sp. NPDC051014 TaxID=3155751 RepID=UPI0033EF9E93
MHKNYWDRFAAYMAECLSASLAVFDLDESKARYREAGAQGASHEDIGWDAFHYWKVAAADSAQGSSDIQRGLQWEEAGIQDSAILDFSEKESLAALLGTLAVLLSREDPEVQEEVERVTDASMTLIVRLVTEAQETWAPLIPKSNDGSYRRNDRMRHGVKAWEEGESQPLPPSKAKKKVKLSEVSTFAFYDPANPNGSPLETNDPSITTKTWEGAWGNRHRIGKRRPNDALSSNYGSVEEWAKGNPGWEEYLEVAPEESATHNLPSAATARPAEAVDAKEPATHNLPSASLLNAEEMRAIHRHNKRAVKRLIPAHGSIAAQEIGFTVYYERDRDRRLLVIGEYDGSLEGLGLQIISTGSIATPRKGARGFAASAARIFRGEPLKGEVTVRCDDDTWKFMPALLKGLTAKFTRHGNPL